MTPWTFRFLPASILKLSLNWTQSSDCTERLLCPDWLFSPWYHQSNEHFGHCIAWRGSNFKYLKIWASGLFFLLVRPAPVPGPALFHTTSVLSGCFHKERGSNQRGLERTTWGPSSLWIFFALPTFTMSQCSSSSSSLSVGLLFLLVAYTAAGKGCSCVSGFQG